jgi:16S rRNA (adenine1518-N6/adenine1519-N6)-dimethyltransferase
MVQREVRDRLLAAPATKAFGALTVFTRAVFDVRSVCIVPAGAFHPAPRVDSAVIALTPRAEPIDPALPAFSTVVRLAFEARRKTLRNALLRGFSADAVDRALGQTAIAGTRRGETLSIDEFQALALALQA